MSRRGSTRWTGGFAVAAIACAALPVAVVQARGETLESALMRTYQNNPTLNSQRAAVRATDEGVPQALSGYRPKISITASGGEQSLSSNSQVVSGTTPPGSPATYFSQSGYNATYGAGIAATQTIFNGFQTANRSRQAESQVSAAREALRTAEQTVLLNAVTAYMNLLRDHAILELQKRNIEVLEEQLRQTRDRFNVSDVTRTDVAQSESRLAAGRSQVLIAQSNYTASLATYRQVIGSDPGKLTSATPVDRFSPRNLGDAIGYASATHPSVTTAQYNVDVALLQVKVAEGALYPTLSVQANVQKNYFPVGGLNTVESYNATVLGQLSVPIYQGGAEYSLIRQAKETLGEKRLDLDSARDQVRQNVVQSWGQLEAAKSNIEATKSQVQAAEIALNGVREEARVGQRTTLDVLNAQQELVNGRVALVSAQRDRVVASFTLLAAVGRLSPLVLGLHVPTYNVQAHYEQVRDSWAGVRTPDGR